MPSGQSMPTLWPPYAQNPHASPDWNVKERTSPQTDSGSVRHYYLFKRGTKGYLTFAEAAEYPVSAGRVAKNMGQTVFQRALIEPHRVKYTYVTIPNPVGDLQIVNSMTPGGRYYALRPFITGDAVRQWTTEVQVEHTPTADQLPEIIQRVFLSYHSKLANLVSQGILYGAKLPTGDSSQWAGAGVLNALAFLQKPMKEVERDEVPPALRDALEELAGIKEVAREDDCEEPTETAINNAKFLLPKIYEFSPRTYDIYPMGGGEVVIDGGNRGHRIGVFCYSDGRVLYVGWENGERRMIRKSGTSDIPYDLLLSALSQLDD